MQIFLSGGAMQWLKGKRKGRNAETQNCGGVRQGYQIEAGT